jgi:hypothetical protein
LVFLDWYNHEHVPLRLNRLKSFLTGARFIASDSLSPSWLALYDIDDTATFSDESYTRLRTDRSPREADIIRRLHMMDRRTCELTHDTGESVLTTSFRCGNPTKYLVTHEIESDELDVWKEEYLPALKAVDGWVRTRVFRCIDNLKNRSTRGAPEESVPQSLVVHGVFL